jgi:hypothetical protein
MLRSSLRNHCISGLGAMKPQDSLRNDAVVPDIQATEGTDASGAIIASGHGLFACTLDVFLI